MHRVHLSAGPHSGSLIHDTLGNKAASSGHHLQVKYGLFTRALQQEVIFCCNLLHLVAFLRVLQCMVWRRREGVARPKDLHVPRQQSVDYYRVNRMKAGNMGIFARLN